MGTFDDLRNKGQEYAEGHPEQVEKVSDQAIDKGGDQADRATGDKYGQQIDSAQQKADDAVGQ
ncbi:antitoxin [Kineosporia sp. J2-2]|uniref:Antitoxin n=1 Tax=Kineosporia corallincola TaxID=2835133 RepID=A0ABS5TPD7_9ACTN|nr:antitoxin [Kineosporia corallincola]MBT0772688.1 antitoxin [Kineosporia corallincola]